MQDLYEVASYALLEYYVMRSDEYLSFSAEYSDVELRTGLNLYTDNIHQGYFTVTIDSENNNVVVIFTPNDNESAPSVTTLTADHSLSEIEEAVSAIQPSVIETSLPSTVQENPQIQGPVVSASSEDTDSSNATEDTAVIEAPNVLSQRFSGASWYDIVSEFDLLFIGCGGIGSWASVIASRFRPNSITLVDNDVAEPVNMAGQLFTASTMTLPKVRALNDLINNISLYNNVNTFNERFSLDSKTILEGKEIVICGLDNMLSRAVVFNEWVNYVESLDSVEKRKNYMFIDGRLAAEKMQVFCITGDNDFQIQNYKRDYLFDDREADATVCSYKQTTYCAAMIGSLISNCIVNFAHNLSEPFIERELPFMVEYDAEFMYLKTKVQ